MESLRFESMLPTFIERKWKSSCTWCLSKSSCTSVTPFLSIETKPVMASTKTRHHTFSQLESGLGHLVTTLPQNILENFEAKLFLCLCYLHNHKLIIWSNQVLVSLFFRYLVASLSHVTMIAYRFHTPKYAKHYWLHCQGLPANCNQLSRPIRMVGS